MREIKNTDLDVPINKMLFPPLENFSKHPNLWECEIEKGLLCQSSKEKTI